MGLAGVDVLCTIPLATYAICTDLTTSPVEAYVSWDYAHANFAFVEQIPSVLWKADSTEVVSIELSRWFVVICAVVFFAFFGFADEARRNYRLAYVSVAKRIGLSTGSISASGTWTANGYVNLKYNLTRAGSHGPYSLNSTNPNTSYNSRSATTPIIITRQKKRDSLASFSSRLSLPDYGGAMADLKEGPFSPTATSPGSMSKESLPRSPAEMDDVPLPAIPEATLDANALPRNAPDVSHVA
jgi:pheromone a factor receptor